MAKSQIIRKSEPIFHQPRNRISRIRWISIQGKLSSVVLETLKFNVLKITAVLTSRQEWSRKVHADSAAPAVQGRHLIQASVCSPLNRSHRI